MADTEGGEKEPRRGKQLSRLRAQRAARMRGDTGGLAEISSAGGRQDASDGSARPMATHVPAHMRNVDSMQSDTDATDGAPAMSRPEPVLLKRAQVSNEDRMSQRIQARTKAMNAVSSEDMDKSALKLSDIAQFIGLHRAVLPSVAF